jgi:hypothetical protein
MMVHGYPFRSGCCETRSGCENVWAGYCAGGSCGHGKHVQASCGCGGMYVAQKHSRGGKGGRGACGCGSAFSFKLPSIFSSSCGCGTPSRAVKGHAVKGHPVQSHFGKGHGVKGHSAKGHASYSCGSGGSGLFDWLHAPSAKGHHGADCGCHGRAGSKWEAAPSLQYDYPPSAPLELQAPPIHNPVDLEPAPEPAIESARRGWHSIFTPLG